MYIVQNYPLAILFCVITMFCWGSWGNTQKLASTTWRYEYFYWDYVIGVLLFSLISAFTLGSTGAEGQSFLENLSKADSNSLGSAFLGVGLALVLGVLINYFGAAKGEPLYIFVGVVFIVIAILMNALAYRKASAGVKQDSASSSAGDKKTSATQTAQAKKVLTKGILLSVACGIIMSLFYRFVVASMDMENFAAPAAGKLTPYTAVVIFALGVFASNFIFNTFAMKRPVSGDPIPVSGYFKGKPITHMVGMLGGIIWCVGQSFSMIASEKAGAAISYGLGQGATLVSAAWGIFIWKEFKDAPAASGKLNAGMFVFFLIGLAFLIYAGA